MSWRGRGPASSSRRFSSWGRRNMISGVWKRVIPAAGAALAYGVASALDGSGFIAAFVSGMVFRCDPEAGPGGRQPSDRRWEGVLSGSPSSLFRAILLRASPGRDELEASSCSWSSASP